MGAGADPEVLRPRSSRGRVVRPAHLDDAVIVDFEEWIKQQLAAGPGPRPGVPPPRPMSSRWRGRVLQGAAVLITLAVIGFGLGSTGALAPITPQLGRSAQVDLPVTTWAGSPQPPSPAAANMEGHSAAAQGEHVPGTMDPPSGVPSGGAAHPGGVVPMSGPVPSAPGNPNRMGGPPPSGSHPSPVDPMAVPSPGPGHHR